MKKQTLLLLIAFMGVGTYFAQTAKEKQNKPHFLQNKKKEVQHVNIQSKNSQYVLPGRSLDYYWDSNSSNWMFNDTSIYNYNVNGLLSEVITIYGFSKNRTLYTYDSKERETLVLYQNWDSFTNQWKDSNKNTSTYDAQGNQTLYTNESYNNILNVWEINYGNKNIYTYNSSNLMTSNTSQNWDSNTQTYEDYNRTVNITYNANGNITQQEFQVKNGSAWDNSSIEKYTYDIFNKLIELEEQDWDGSAYVKTYKYHNVIWHIWGGDLETSSISSYTTSEWGTPILNQWNVSGRSSSTYDAYGGSVFLDEMYVNSVFVNDSRYSDLYDSKYNNIGYRNETWITSSSTWSVDGGSNINHTYDASNNITQTIWQYWQSNNSNYVNSNKKVYSDFQTITGIKEQNNSLVLNSSMFPNPCHTNCNIKLENKNALDLKDASIKLFDISGKQVYTSKISNEETTINVEGLTSGIYFYSVSNSNVVLTRGKLVVD